MRRRGRGRPRVRPRTSDPGPSAMADSSSGEERSDGGSGSWVMYRDRPEWADVTPVKQDDGPNPVVAIAYSEKFIDVYDYFRAILNSGEKSERALALTADALNFNPANYTVWQCRREILKGLQADIEAEMQYSRMMIETNPKNYQVWHHRRVVVEWSGDASEDLQLTESVLDGDSKNYHAWEHRQWVLRNFSLWEGELEYLEDLLKSDIRNNSAWNQRHFVIVSTTQFSQDVIEREVNVALRAIQMVINNESAWNYLRGVLSHYEKGMGEHPKVSKFCQELYDAGNRSPYLLGFLVDTLQDKLEKGESEDKDDLIARITELCKMLASEFDTIRSGYWNFIAESVKPKDSGAKEEEDQDKPTA